MNEYDFEERDEREADDDVELTDTEDFNELRSDVDVEALARRFRVAIGNDL